MAAAWLLVPGYAIGGRLLPEPAYDAIDRLLAAPAVTLACVALVTLWSSLLGLRLGPGVVAISGVLVLGVRLLPAAAAWPRYRKWIAWRAVPPSAMVAAAYAVLVAVALAARLSSTRDVLPTLGADAYHHTLISLLIVEHGALPGSYEPYAAIASFAYHFGFHAFVAWLHWATDAEIGVLVGLAGHLLNVAVALSVAFFVRRTLRDDVAAGIAAWLVALLCVFPAYFVNWGRFTQTAGLVLLPVAAALALDAAGCGTMGRYGRLEAGGAPLTGSARLRTAVAAALVAAGLGLAHYRLVAMLAVLLAVWLVVWALVSHVGRGRTDSPAPWSRLGRRSLSGVSATVAAATACLAAIGIGAVGLTAPWLLVLRRGLALGLGERPGDYAAGYFDLERLGSAIDQPTNGLVLALAAAGLLVAFHCRAWPVLALGAWAIVQVALANPHWWPVAVPVAGPVDLVTVLGTMGFPVAVAAAFLIAMLFAMLRRSRPPAAFAAAVVLGCGGTALGLWQLQALVTPRNALVGTADLTAIDWLQANTPRGARVAINAVVFPWATDYVVGIDAGYWLPLLAARGTTVLPMVYPGERGSDPAAAREMVAITRALTDAPASAATFELLRAAGVEYIYHGGGPGPVRPEGLLANPALRLVYDHDGVRVWRVQST